MTTQQWIALGIFVLSYGLIISEKVSRTIASILGAVLAFLFILTPQDLLHYENWETILFVFGMMTVIETMSESGFFRWGPHYCCETQPKCDMYFRILFFWSLFSTGFRRGLGYSQTFSTSPLEDY
jgi:Na+/H+ antiporter NhaD/arsenite permease-like protein